MGWLCHHRRLGDCGNDRWSRRLILLSAKVSTKDNVIIRDHVFHADQAFPNFLDVSAFLTLLEPIQKRLDRIAQRLLKRADIVVTHQIR
jgi:hypothetical protein